MNCPQCSLNWIFAIGLLASAAFAAREAKAADAKSVTVYVGTYTGPKSKGIYVMKLDLASGALSKPEVAGEMKNPSFLVIHPNNKYLYAIGEVDEFKAKKTGAIAA